jgi:cell division protein FtsB
MQATIRSEENSTRQNQTAEFNQLQEQFEEQEDTLQEARTNVTEMIQREKNEDFKLWIWLIAISLLNLGILGTYFGRKILADFRERQEDIRIGGES